MLEGSSMEISKAFLALLVALGITAICMVFIAFGQAQDAKQYVNYQIERNGGLNSTAQTNINAYINKEYGGRFTVVPVSSSDAQTHQYGTMVQYTIKGQLKVPFFPTIPAQVISVPGSALSLVR